MGLSIKLGGVEVWVEIRRLGCGGEVRVVILGGGGGGGGRERWGLEEED